ncbi:hypothetical protein HK405_015382, partial [Cladochytrium tenue]
PISARNGGLCGRDTTACGRGGVHAATVRHLLVPEDLSAVGRHQLNWRSNPEHSAVPDAGAVCAADVPNPLRSPNRLGHLYS